VDWIGVECSRLLRLMTTQNQVTVLGHHPSRKLLILCLVGLIPGETGCHGVFLLLSVWSSERIQIYYLEFIKLKGILNTICILLK